MSFTIEGFIAKTNIEIKDEIVTEIRDKIASDFSGDNDTQGGRLIAILSEREAILQELILELYSSLDPNFAEGIRLDAICALSGITRKAATKTRVFVNCDLDSNTTLPKNTRLNINGQSDKIFQLINEFTSVSAGVYSLEFESIEAGKISCPANTLNIILDDIEGFNSATNPLDGVIGTNTENDTELKKRRNESLFSQGSSSLNGIRSALLTGVQGVLSVDILENDKLSFYNDLPPKTFEVVIDDNNNTNNNATIAQIIFDKKAAGGGETFGNILNTVTFNDNTQSKIIYFSRPNLITYYLTVTVVLIENNNLTVNDKNQLNNDINAGLTEYLNTLTSGQDIIMSKINCFILNFSNNISDVESLKIGLTSNPTNENNILIGFREKAVFSTNRNIITIEG